MSAATFLEEIRGLGIDIIPTGEDIRCRAPRGALTPDLLEKIRAHKAEILTELQGKPTLDEILSRQRWGLPPPEEFLVAPDPPVLSDSDIIILRAAIDRQARADCPEVRQWLLAEGGQAYRYQGANPTWTSEQCEAAGMVDLLLWQRQRWLKGDTREELIGTLLDDLDS